MNNDRATAGVRARGRPPRRPRISRLGAWRSLVARTVRVGEVPGSNPGAPIAMEHDERAADEPSDGGIEATPQEQRGDDPGQDPVDSPGPYGNPESDPETLSHRQQEGEEPEGDA